MPNFIAASRVVRAAGQTYQGSPASLIDGDAGTTADLYLTGSSQADWFNLDLGGEVVVQTVTLVNVTGSSNPLTVIASNTPSAEPNGSQWTCPNPVPTASPQTLVFTAPSGGQMGRYVQVRQSLINAFSSAAVIGGVSYTLAPPAGVPVPALSATPSLPGNVPSIILQGV